MAERKPKASELEYHGSEARPRDKTQERSIAAVHEGRIVGHLSSTMEPGRGRALKLAWVDPDFQRRGVGTTMVRLEAFRAGHTPLGDNAVSKKGLAFQKGLGLTPKPVKGYGGQEIQHVAVADLFGGPAGERAVSETIQGKQGHMLSEPQFDPDIVKHAAPHPTLPRRRSKPAVQEELFSGAGYEQHFIERLKSTRARAAEVFGGGTPRNARGQIQSKKRQQ